jgi:hypothetical protein
MFVPANPRRAGVGLGVSVTGAVGVGLADGGTLTSGIAVAAALDGDSVSEAVHATSSNAAVTPTNAFLIATLMAVPGRGSSRPPRG